MFIALLVSPVDSPALAVRDRGHRFFPVFPSIKARTLSYIDVDDVRKLSCYISSKFRDFSESGFKEKRRERLPMVIFEKRMSFPAVYFANGLSLRVCSCLRKSSFIPCVVGKV